MESLRHTKPPSGRIKISPSYPWAAIQAETFQRSVTVRVHTYRSSDLSRVLLTL